MDGPTRDDEAPPGRFTANMPQRYLFNFERYAARGGLIRLPEDMRGFLARPTNAGDMSRFYFLCLAFDQITREGLKGDFAELGVYKGYTASLIATMARKLGRTAYLLDTFAGFSDADLKGIDARVRKGFADTSVEAVRALVGDQNVAFVPGYFPASAARIPADASFSLVHLDCDLHAPTASALEYFYPRLVPGGFLIIHDYSSLHWMGVEKAVDEFFATKPESVIPLPDSAGSAVIRKSRAPDRFANWYARRNAGLLGPDWTPAANLAPILGDGWSAPEGWGIWGIDEAHQFIVFLDAPPDRDIALEFDVGASLYAGAPREIGVFSGGRKLQDWIFSAAQNRSVRTLRIPPDHLPVGDDRLPVIVVEFRPAVVISVEEQRSRGGDQRRTGLSLHRVSRVA